MSLALRTTNPNQPISRDDFVAECSNEGHSDFDCQAALKEAIHEGLVSKSTLGTVTSDERTASVQTPDYHDQRAKSLGYWNSSIVYLAESQVYLDLATAAISQGNSVDASSSLSQGEKAADHAVTAVQVDVPDGWDDVSWNLITSAQDLKSAMTSVRSYLDDKKPSEGSDAEQHGQEARDALESAQHEAHVHYLKLAGNASDLMSIRDAVKEEEAALSALAGS